MDKISLGLPGEPADAMIGQTIGPYRIDDRIGHGGMGIVYRAEDTRLGRTVALKFLPEALTFDPEATRRFLLEARAAAALNHPNICTLHDIGQSENGRTYLVMECVDGTTLRGILDDNRMAEYDAVAIATQIAEGLERAHEAGIIHRDLKPANIMITGHQRAKLLDFGLAKLNAPQDATQIGTTVGTVAYMSPEQSTGASIDHRTDIWSLGVVLYEMLTGMRPFSGDFDAAVIYQILNVDPTPVVVQSEAVSIGLSNLVDQLLTKDPQGRVQTMTDVLAALRSPAGAVASSRGSSELSSGAPADLLRAGQTALDQGKWREAVTALRASDAAKPLTTAESLESLADAAWWTGDLKGSISTRERAVAAWINRGETQRAGLLALRNAEDFAYQNADSVARGWYARAARLIGDESDSVAFGYLQRFRSLVALKRLDFDEALSIAKDAHRIGAIHQDLELQALALQDQGRILIALGDLVAGLPLIDEAMATAVSGSLSVLTTGKLYCNMMDTCEQLSDYDRAGQWSESGIQWCESHSESVFPGICRVYHAKVLGLRGDWSAAQSEARKASEELKNWLPIAGEAWYQIGEIRLRQGELDLAELAFEQAHELGREPFPGMAELRRLRGQHEQAKSLMDVVLSSSRMDGPTRAGLLPTQILIAIEMGDVELAERLLDELCGITDRYPSNVLSATVAELRAAVSLACDDVETSITSARDAIRYWSDLGFPYETARSRLTLARAYIAAGSFPSAQLEVGSARSAFGRLGAKSRVAEAEVLLSDALGPTIGAAQSENDEPLG